MNSIYKRPEGKAEILGFYENLLKVWFEPHEKHLVETGFGETFVLESGEKTNPNIVLLHGTGSNSAMWTADVHELSKGYHVYAIDTIGECGKSAENRPDLRGNDYTEWLNEIFTKLDIDSATIIGCSLGGWIASGFAIQYPQKVNKLILLASAGISQLRFSALFWIIITSFFGKWGFKKINRMVYGNLEIDKTALQFAELIKKYFKPRTESIPVFSDQMLQQIKAPVYFIGGANDFFYNSKETARRLNEHIKSVRFEILEKTGHVLINQTVRMLEYLEQTVI